MRPPGAFSNAFLNSSFETFPSPLVSAFSNSLANICPRPAPPGPPGRLPAPGLAGSSAQAPAAIVRASRLATIALFIDDAPQTECWGRTAQVIQHPRLAAVSPHDHAG